MAIPVWSIFESAIIHKLQALLVYRNLATDEQAKKLHDIDAIVDFASQFAEHDDKHVRIYLCQILHTTSANKPAVSMLMKLLLDQDRDVSFWAMMAIGHETVISHYWHLQTVVRDTHSNHHTRLHALQLVAGIGQHTTTKFFLEGFLYSNDKLIRGYAAKYLGDWNYSQYVPQMLMLFQCNDARSKGGAILGLQSVGYKNRSYYRELHKLESDPTIICEYGTLGQMTIGQAAHYALNPPKLLTHKPNKKRWYKRWLKKYNPEFYHRLNF